MSKFIPPEMYRRYRDEVLKLTNIRQRFEPGKRLRGLSDQEIASHLGLKIEEVVEIRCLAELEVTPLEAALEAEEIKEERFKG